MAPFVYQGVTYPTVIVGTQEWMTIDFRAVKYNDGTTPIPEIDSTSHSGALPKAFTWYDLDGLGHGIPTPDYAPLYTNAVLSDPGFLPPGGWRIPTYNGWISLLGVPMSSPTAPSREPGTSHWILGGGTNTTLFGAIPCGRVYYDQYNSRNKSDRGSQAIWYGADSAQPTLNSWNVVLDSATYGMNASLPLDKVFFSVRLVRDVAAPVIITQPIDITVVQHIPVTFKTFFQSLNTTGADAGSPFPGLKWWGGISSGILTYTSVPATLPGVTAETDYVIADPTSDLDGTYYWTSIGTDLGSVVSVHARLTVIYQPVVHTQPSDITAWINQVSPPVQFSVVGYGNSLTYQWFRNSSPIGGANSSTYLITDPAYSDNGATFYCIMTNSVGSVQSNTVTLTVNNVPTVIDPASQSANVGETKVFSVSASGVGPFTYQWTRGGIAIPGETNASYTTPPVDHSYNGASYRCEVSNPSGTTISNPAILTVNTYPYFDVDPVQTVTAPGYDATFVAHAVSVGPTYKWKKNNIDIPSSNTPSYTTPINTLINNGDQYVCVVTDVNGTATSSMAVLIVVNSPPIIYDQPQNLMMATDQRAIFTIVASSFLPLARFPLSYQWYQGHVGSSVLIPGATLSSYSFVVTPINGGPYYCVVTNVCGSTTSDEATLTVIDESEVTSTYDQSQAQSDIVIEIWDAQADCGVTKGNWVVFSPTSYDTYNSPGPKIIDGLSVSGTITPVYTPDYDYWKISVTKAGHIFRDVDVTVSVPIVPTPIDSPLNRDAIIHPADGYFGKDNLVLSYVPGVGDTVKKNTYHIGYAKANISDPTILDLYVRGKDLNFAVNIPVPPGALGTFIIAHARPNISSNITNEIITGICAPNNDTGVRTQYADIQNQLAQYADENNNIKFRLRVITKKRTPVANDFPSILQYTKEPDLAHHDYIFPWGPTGTPEAGFDYTKMIIEEIVTKFGMNYFKCQSV